LSIVPGARRKANYTAIPVWHSNGRQLVVAHEPGPEAAELWSRGSFSPDGRFVAYVSEESGQYEVYLSTRAAGGIGSLPSRAEVGR